MIDMTSTKVNAGHLTAFSQYGTVTFILFLARQASPKILLKVD
jgi:hypothetical protein